MIGIRASMNCFRVSLSHNLAVREYNPTPTERRNNQASNILINYLCAVLVEFNIDLDDILTFSTDSGSDIKRGLEVVFKTLREWCTSHLLNLSVVDAFGTCVDKNKNQNKKARDIFSRVRRLIKFVNKSGIFKALFDENVKDVFERFLKLHYSPNIVGLQWRTSLIHLSNCGMFASLPCAICTLHLI